MSEEKLNAWKKSYTWVLIANVIYILLFCLMMLIFS